MNTTPEPKPGLQPVPATVTPTFGLFRHEPTQAAYVPDPLDGHDERDRQLAVRTDRRDRGRRHVAALTALTASSTVLGVGALTLALVPSGSASVSAGTTTSAATTAATTPTATTAATTKAATTAAATKAAATTTKAAPVTTTTKAAVSTTGGS